MGLVSLSGARRETTPSGERGRSYWVGASSLERRRGGSLRDDLKISTKRLLARGDAYYLLINTGWYGGFPVGRLVSVPSM